MKKVAQKSSTGGVIGRATRGKSASSGKSATRGKIASNGTSCASSGTDLCHQWHYNYQRNYHGTMTRAGETAPEGNIIPFAGPPADNVVPMAPEGLRNFCPAPGRRKTFDVSLLYASQAELLAKVVPCIAAEPRSPKVVCAQDVGRIWMTEVIGAPWYDQHKEALVALALDARRKCLHVFLISLGTLTETLASPREVFRPLIAAAAHSFILCHNHPSGDTKPSEQDRQMTKTMKEAGLLLGIPMVDSLVFAHPDKTGVWYYSFSENKEL
jgi:DNA repair protein RadC